MISKFFIKGTTFTWNAPQPISPANMDGTIVQSGQNPGPAMTYSGLDNEITYGKMRGPLASVYASTSPPQSHGLNANQPVPNIWLNYVLGRTAYMQTAGGDVLTGFMSGCWITTWTEGGNRYVGHVGTVESSPKDQPPNSTVKNTFAAKFAGNPSAGTNLKGFNPASAWSLSQIRSVCKESTTSWGSYMGNSKIMALVTRNNHFYSILMIKNGNDWICGGSKRVHSKDQAAVLRALA